MRAAAGRKKAEADQKRRAQQAVAQEKAMIARMKNDIRELTREVERLKQNLAKGTAKADPPKTAKK